MYYGEFSPPGTRYSEIEINYYVVCDIENQVSGAGTQAQQYLYVLSYSYFKKPELTEG